MQDDFVDRVRAVPILDVVGQRVELTRRGHRYVGNCPFHADKTPSFHVTERPPLFFCFGCKVGGDVITFSQMIDSIGFVDAVRSIARSAGISEPIQYQPPEKYMLKEKQRSEAFDTLRTLHKAHVACFEGSPAEQYLLGRGISKDTCMSHMVGYAPTQLSWLSGVLGENWKHRLSSAGLMTSRLGYLMRGRMVLPIHDQYGSVVSFGGRILGDSSKSPKYTHGANSRVFDKPSTLFGAWWASDAIKKTGIAIVVEGYLDVLGLRQAGFENVVASMGTSFHPSQARILAKNAREVILGFDSDQAGKSGIIKALPILLGTGLIVRILDVAPYKDPFECMLAEGPDEFNKRLMSCHDAVGYLMELKSEHVAAGPRARASAAAEIAGIVSHIKDPLERSASFRTIADRFKLSPLAVEQSVDLRRVDVTPRAVDASIGHLGLLGLVITNSDCRAAASKDQTLQEAMKSGRVGHAFAAAVSMGDEGNIGHLFDELGRGDNSGAYVTESINFLNGIGDSLSYESCRDEVVRSWKEAKLKSVQDGIESAERLGRHEDVISLVRAKQELMEIA